jgi:ATP-binding cassette subfamily B multidrug efflux pump
LKIFKFLRPEWKALLLVFLLLTAQAASELSLPGITSSLVNVGVQQDGIEDALAQRLSSESMGKLLALTDDAGRAAVGIAYEAQGAIFRLREGLTEAERAAAREALTLPMAITLMTQALPAGILQNLTKGGVSRETLIARIGPMLPQGIGSLEQAAQRAAVQFVRAEYGRLGVDLTGIRNAYLWRQGFIMLGLTLLTGLTALLTSFLSGRAGARVGKSLRRREFARVLSFSKADIDRFSTASLITRSTNDITQIQNTSVMILRMLLYAPIMGLGGIWRVSQLRTGLGWIVAVTVVLMISLVVITAGIVTPRFKILQKLVDRMNLVARENLTGVQVIRAFSREADETRRYEKANADLTDVNRFINYAFSYVMPLMMLVISVVTLAILWFGAGRIDQGGMQVGDMIAFISYTMQIAFSFMMMAVAGAVMLPRAEVAAGRVQEVLSTEPSSQAPESPSRCRTGPVPAFGSTMFPSDIRTPRRRSCATSPLTSKTAMSRRLSERRVQANPACST